MSNHMLDPRIPLIVVSSRHRRGYEARLRRTFVVGLVTGALLGAGVALSIGVFT